MSKPSAPHSEEITLKICERLADGEALKNICAGEGMPTRSTVYEWLANNAAFLTMYRAAREEHADAEFDRIAAANITCMAAGS